MAEEDWNHVICIDNWPPDEAAYEKGYYPEGTRDKAVYFSPSEGAEGPLRPTCRYLLKKSRAWAPWQFWMEVMGHRIGQLIGVAVPPAYVGVSHVWRPGEASYGALIEWFYWDDEQFIEGAHLIGPLIEGFDYGKGSQHNLQTILDLDFHDGSSAEQTRRWLVDYWAKVLTFDTVIGNVDRHPANWGVVVTRGATGDVVARRLSPAFDNGTAMSYEQPEEHFRRFEDDQYVRKYLTRPDRARHHMRWDLTGAGPLNFFDFMRRFVSAYPESRATVLEGLGFTEESLRARLGPLVAIKVNEASRLTQCRLDFTLKLIMKRAELLRDAMEKP
jgi:hypothetical protein